MYIEEVAAKVESLEKEVSNITKDVAVIMSHVTNHIPHILSEHKEVLDSLAQRLQPVEKKNIQLEAVSGICSIVLKAVLAVGTIIWTTIQITHFFAK